MQRVMKYATLLTFHLHAVRGWKHTHFWIGGGGWAAQWAVVRVFQHFVWAKFMRELRQMLQLTSTIQKLANI